MKHIFFAFPAGAAGIALVLFRLSASILIASAAGHMPAYHLWQSCLFYLIATGLVAGFPTRLISAASIVGAIVLAWNIDVYQISSLSGFILNMLALMLIGPGAYSIDATLFGRRTVHLPE
jgi:hypothetical protein